MGWETTLVTTISYNRKTYNSIYEVEADLEDTKTIIQNLKNDLQALVMTTDPRKMMSEDELKELSPFDWMRNKLDSIMENLEEYQIEEWKLNVLVKEWDKCHDKETGLAIPILKPTGEKDENGYIINTIAPNEEEIEKLSIGETSFIDGDYIDTIYNKYVENAS